jgi:tetraacyldisaccharide 4'-kinase
MPAMLIDVLNPYAWIMRARRAMYRSSLLHSYSVGIPVISIGNLSAGGTGKTPFSIYLTHLIEQQYHKQVAVVLRGYKRRSSGLLVVRDSTGIHASVNESGDEAQLLARELVNAIVICDEDRVRGATTANKLGADVVILDDGFQHMRIKRDLNILLVNQIQGIPAVIPFGKGRETASAVDAADMIVMTNSDSRNSLFKDKPTLYTSTTIKSFEQISPQTRRLDPAELKEKTVLAVSGIGNPESFENTIRPFVRHIIPLRFPDHAEYDDSVSAQINGAVEQNKCDLIITTSKDEVKLMPLLARGKKVNTPTLVARSEMIITEGEDVLEKAISALLNKK